MTLDETSLQKLLMAAWVIQCEHDRLRVEADGIESCFGSDAPPIALQDWPKTSVVGVRPATDCAAILRSASIAIGPAAKLPPARVEQTSSAEVAGALALAPEPCSHPVVTSVAAVGPQAIQKPISGLLPEPESHPRTALTLVRSNRQIAHGKFDVIRFLRSTSARSLLGAIFVLLIMVSFVTMEVGAHRSRVSAESPSPSNSSVQSAANPHLQSRLEASHRRVTDSSISSELEGLSRYEIGTIRRQAQFGDDHAALILAMARELGQGTPQSCTEAARWVQIAAENGNAAAQYNLGLRLIEGDGVSASTDEGRRWLQASAALGYDKAQAALHELR